MNAFALYNRFALLACITFYLVILAGGVVRMTGSGMGCPDWPKCFGQYIPPTDASQIPANYKDLYANKRKAKNQKLGEYLSKLGFEDLATRIIEDESIYIEQDFNVTKTYTEYINRLVGAVSGLFVFGAFISSFFLLRKSVKYFFFALSLLVITGFQAWLGSIVVSTNLLPGMITIHMLFAFVLIGIAMKMAINKNGEAKQILISKEVRYLLLFALVLTFLQVAIGTQVREEIDFFKNSLRLERSEWLAELGGTYTIHKITSFFLVAINLFLFAVLRREGSKESWISMIPVVVLLMLFSGLAMNFFSVPALMQPIHLLGSSILFGAQYYLFLKGTTRIKQIASPTLNPAEYSS